MLYNKFFGGSKETGELQGWSGEPILLDSSVEEDPGILKELEPYKETLAEYRSQLLATSRVALENSRVMETNLGNLVTDAGVWYYSNKTLKAILF